MVASSVIESREYRRSTQTGLGSSLATQLSGLIWAIIDLAKLSLHKASRYRGTVSDIIVNQGPLNYSPNTADLAKRMEAAPLAGKTTLSGPASSCIAFDPTTSICSNFTPVPLSTTNLGSLYLFEPYTVDACTYRITITLFSTALDNACNSSPTDGPLFISVNWGAFWVEMED